MRYNYFTICSLFALSIASAPLFADTPVAASPAQPAAQQSVDQLQSDYARLKTEMDETLAQLRRLKAELAASSTEQPAAAPAPVAPPDAASLDRKIDQIIAAQTKLELKLAALEVQQAKTELARQQAAAATIPNDVNSPYAYRYNANPGSSASPDAAAPQPPAGSTSATYTTYSNGYTSGYYTPPVQAVQSTGPVVYVNPQPVIYSSPTYVYPGWYGPAYPYYYRPYYRPYYYRPSSLSIGVSDSHFFFGFNTGVRFGGRDYHHGRHH